MPHTGIKAEEAGQFKKQGRKRNTQKTNQTKNNIKQNKQKTHSGPKDKPLSPMKNTMAHKEEINASELLY